MRDEENTARWERRLAQLVQYRQDGNDWPLYQNGSSEEDRVLGMWLHGQRISFRNGILSKEHEGKLDAQLDGWRAGRSHRSSGPKSSRPAG